MENNMRLNIRIDIKRMVRQAYTDRQVSDIYHPLLVILAFYQQQGVRDPQIVIPEGYNLKTYIKEYAIKLDPKVFKRSAEW